MVIPGPGCAQACSGRTPPVDGAALQGAFGSPRDAAGFGRQAGGQRPEGALRVIRHVSKVPFGSFNVAKVPFETPAMS